MNYRNLIVSGLAASALSIPSIAAAQAPIIVEGQYPTAVVSFADLNLASASGVSTLNGRIRRAAESVCVDNNVRGVGEEMAQRGCISFALNHARGQMERAIALYGTSQLASRTITVAGR